MGILPSALWFQVPLHTVGVAAPSEPQVIESYMGAFLK